MTLVPTSRVLALLALLTFIGLAPASAATSSSAYEKEVISATNSYRASLNKAAVKHQSCVDKWAEDQAQWMADTKKFAHREGRLRKIMKDCRLTGASENIAWNFPSGSKTVTAWKNSAGHAKNMRAPKMRFVGVGAVLDSDGQWWVAQVFGTRK
jgi:uncharacterized protein YkwD